MGLIHTTHMPPIQQKLPLRSWQSLLIFGVLAGGLTGTGVLLRFSSHAGTNPDLVAQTTLEGTLDVVHGDDFVHQKTTMAYSLTTNSGTRIPVNFTHDMPTDLLGQSRVQVVGKLANNALTITNPGSVKKEQTSAPAPNIHKTAIILYNYQDNTKQPYAASFVQDAIFTSSTSTNAFFRAESSGLAGLTGITSSDGDIFGYYTIPLKDTNCDIYGWSNAADQAAKAGGHDLSGYDNIVYISPDTSCFAGGEGGNGEIPGKRTWIFQSRLNSSDSKLLSAAAAHELTHNLGTYHANSYVCEAAAGPPIQYVPILDNEYQCQHIEYGDIYDMMGVGDLSMYESNNFFLDRLGWLAPASVKTVTTSGDYTLDAQEITNASTRAIRLIRNINSRNQVEYYYLDFRQNGGFDTFNDPFAASVTQGITIRLTDPFGSIMSHLLYAHINGNDKARPMQDGDVFNDASHHIKITQISHTVGAVKLHIDVSNVPQPDTTPPSVPTGLSKVSAASRQVVISFNASPEADTDRYNIYRYDNIYRKDVLIGSAFGSSASHTVTYADDQRFIPLQTYTYTARAVDFNGNVSAASAGLDVRIPLPDVIPPTTPASLTASRDGFGEFHLHWDASYDKSGLAGYLITRTDAKTHLSVTIDTGGLYGPRSAHSLVGTSGHIGDGIALAGSGGLGGPNDYYDYPPAGTYTYYVRAYDTDGNKSPRSNSVTMTQPN